MATLTRRIDQFVFPDACVHCQAPADFLYPLVTQSGIDLIGFRFVQVVTLPIPLCEACHSRRKSIGRLVTFGFIAATAAAVGLIAWSLQNEGHPLAGSLILAGFVTTLALIWYWRNWLRRDLDRTLLGVRGKRFKSSTNELTLWFRDQAPSLSEPARFTADPGEQQAARRRSSAFVEMTQAVQQDHDRELARQRAHLIAEREQQSYCLQVPHRPVILAGAVFTFFLAAVLHWQQARPNKLPGTDLDKLVLVFIWMGLFFLAFGGIRITVEGPEIIRSFWGLRKVLDRRTTVIRKREFHAYKLIDASGRRLTISTQLAHHERLLEECQLRTDALAAEPG